jgi:hypothetical protein
MQEFKRFRGKAEKCAFGEDSGLGDPGRGFEEMVQMPLGNCSLSTPTPDPLEALVNSALPYPTFGVNPSFQRSSEAPQRPRDRASSAAFSRTVPTQDEFNLWEIAGSNR